MDQYWFTLELTYREPFFNPNNFAKIGFQNVPMSWYGIRKSLMSTKGILFSKEPSALVWAFEISSCRSSPCLSPPSWARLQWGDKAAPHLTCQGVFLVLHFSILLIQGQFSLPLPPPPICLLRPILFHCLSRKRSKSQNSQFPPALARHLSVSVRQLHQLLTLAVYVCGRVSQMALHPYCPRRTTDIPVFAHFLQVSTFCAFFLEGFNV